MLAAIILNSIHDAASYLAFICRVRIWVRVRFSSCPVYPLAPFEFFFNQPSAVRDSVAFDTATISQEILWRWSFWGYLLATYRLHFLAGKTEGAKRAGRWKSTHVRGWRINSNYVGGNVTSLHKMISKRNLAHVGIAQCMNALADKVQNKKCHAPSDMALLGSYFSPLLSFLYFWHYSSSLYFLSPSYEYCSPVWSPTSVSLSQLNLSILSSPLPLNLHLSSIHFLSLPL